jgi:3-methyladenine DNA glycosylase/8-oxoguanine DNA glycosylase
MDQMDSGTTTPDRDTESLDIAESWKPFRSLAAGYLFLSEFEAKP